MRIVFPVHIETSSGEETWTVTAYLVRDSGRYYFDSFSAVNGEHEYDEPCEALEAGSTWRDDPDEVAAARADHEFDERRDEG